MIYYLAFDSGVDDPRPIGLFDNLEDAIACYKESNPTYTGEILELDILMWTINSISVDRDGTCYKDGEILNV